MSTVPRPPAEPEPRDPEDTDALLVIGLLDNVATLIRGAAPNRTLLVRLVAGACGTLSSLVAPGITTLVVDEREPAQAAREARALYERMSRKVR